MNLQLAHQLEKDTRKMQNFSSELIKLVHNKFLSEQIDDYEFSRIVDLVTCINLKNREMNFNLSMYRLDRERQRKIHARNKIDLKA